ncbi:MAG: ATP-binding cassette domain-containing protein [Acidimicrobiales bacterium]
MRPTRATGQLRPTRAQGARHAIGWLAALLLVYLAAPVVVFLARSARHPSEGFATPGLLGAFATSAEAATISAAIVAVLGVPLAYQLASRRGRLASAASVAVQLPLALPPLMSGVVLLYVFGPNTPLGRLAGGRFTESLAGIVLAQTFVSSPFLVTAARSAFLALDPNMEQVAAVAGMGPLARFARVALPLAAGGIRAGLLLTWLRAFGEYGATVMMAYHPYSLPVFTYVQFSATGLSATQAPSLLALGLAGAVVGLSRLPLTGSRRLLARRRKLPPMLGEGATAGRPRVGRDRSAAPGPPVPVGLDLSTRAGSFRLSLAYRARSHRLAIVGPSGAGKSLTLRALAGLAPGDVSFAGRPVGQLPAERRRVGYVPQGQSLLPDRSAWDNVMLGPYAEAGMAAYWLAALGIARLAGRLPSQLSGGQRQRVALARALSCRPALVLMDEPFSGLDAPVRDGLVRELRHLQLEAALSSVLVTQDFDEAALLADEVMVISGGAMLQAGPVPEVFAHPASPEVARLLGVRNVLAGEAGSEASVRTGQLLVGTAHHGLPAGTALTWCARPDQISVAESPGAEAHRARVDDVADLGTRRLVVLSLGGVAALEAELPAATSPSWPRPGATCWVSLPPEAVQVWAAGEPLSLSDPGGPVPQAAARRWRGPRPGRAAVTGPLPPAVRP